MPFDDVGAALINGSGPQTIMSWYNKINGSYSCRNHRLLTEALRKQWG